ncbi:hypothetical protein EVAR_64012_1 [Eumeta japonica]|uniref:Uncharacterized protein n=1 Tax=Eumeta variegata TaxID=151549 RepID=A0A4C1Z487_EUMVA|nr:hypothetical protein EVAR_64012_1 [Eumeta japonica]
MSGLCAYFGLEHTPELRKTSVQTNLPDALFSPKKVLKYIPASSALSRPSTPDHWVNNEFLKSNHNTRPLPRRAQDLYYAEPGAENAGPNPPSTSTERLNPSFSILSKKIVVGYAKTILNQT